jgi:hypothetical protein
LAGKGPARAERQALSLTAVARCYRRGLRDLFSREVLLVAAFPFALILLLFAAEIAAALIWLIPGLRGWLPPLEGDLLARMVDIFLGLALAGIFTFVNILLAVTLIGVFFTERLVGYVNGKYYRRQLAPFAGNLLVIATSLRYFRKFLGLFLLLSPLYLIPGLNVIAFALPPYFYFRNSVLFDVGSQILSRPAYDTLVARHRRGLHLLLLPLFLLSYLPVIGIFAYIYAFLVLTHFFLAQEVRSLGERHPQGQS